MLFRSAEITINTAIDALSHAVEGMLTLRGNVLSDALAIESISCMASVFEALKKRVFTLEDRRSFLYASMVAGIVISQTGTTAVHSMGYSLTYFRDVDHGRANGLVIVDFLRLVNTQMPEKINRILHAMNMNTLDEFQLLLDEVVGEREVVTKEDALLYASISIKANNVKNCKFRITEKEMEKIYNNISKKL